VAGRLVMAGELPPGGNGGLVTEPALELSVSDSGIGIRPEDLPQVFTEFNRIDKGAAANDGTGLGLAITKRLVEAHRGRIAAESAGVGCGATFRILLPLEGSAAGEAGRPEECRDPYGQS